MEKRRLTLGHSPDPDDAFRKPTGSVPRKPTGSVPQNAILVVDLFRKQGGKPRKWGAAGYAADRVGELLKQS